MIDETNKAGHWLSLELWGMAEVIQLLGGDVTVYAEGRNVKPAQTLNSRTWSATNWGNAGQLDRRFVASAQASEKPASSEHQAFSRAIGDALAAGTLTLFNKRGFRPAGVIEWATVRPGRFPKFPFTMADIQAAPSADVSGQGAPEGQEDDVTWVTSRHAVLVATGVRNPTQQLQAEYEEKYGKSISGAMIRKKKATQKPAASKAKQPKLTPATWIPKVTDSKH